MAFFYYLFKINIVCALYKWYFYDIVSTLTILRNKIYVNYFPGSTICMTFQTKGNLFLSGWLNELGS